MEELEALRKKQDKTEDDIKRLKELEEKFGKKTYSQEDVDKMLQSEADKRVTNALNTAREKWESEFKVKLEQEKKEAERLATLSADEKKKEESKKQIELLEQKEKELKRRELKLDAINILVDEKLPVSFVDMLLGENAEKTNDNIKKFKEAYAKAVEDAVKERIKGTTPTSGGTSGGTKELKDMTSFERLELKKNDPTLYKQLLEKR